MVVSVEFSLGNGERKQAKGHEGVAQNDGPHLEFKPTARGWKRVRENLECPPASWNHDASGKDADAG